MKSSAIYNKVRIAGRSDRSYGADRAGQETTVLVGMGSKHSAELVTHGVGTRSEGDETVFSFWVSIADGVKIHVAERSYNHKLKTFSDVVNLQQLGVE